MLLLLLLQKLSTDRLRRQIVADGKIADLREPLEDFFLRVITESSEGPITIH